MQQCPLAQLQQDIRDRKFHLMLAGTSRDPRLVWVADHCLHLTSATANLRSYYCLADSG